ncbi:MAG: PIN domain-containing protein [Clostridia bacterium]|jgi:predicted nucleic acid-binding protein|nr:PIN domain-containing protein [Clostridia bacterium]
MDTNGSASYVLDTSALLAYYQDEEGAEEVGRILAEAARGEAIVYLSFMTIFEIAYLAIATEGAEEAVKLILQIRELDLQEAWPDETLLWQAAALKARGGMSVADAFIAGLAAATGATLVHRDPEFGRLPPEIRQLTLAKS